MSPEQDYWARMELLLEQRIKQGHPFDVPEELQSAIDTICNDVIMSRLLPIEGYDAEHHRMERLANAELLGIDTERIKKLNALEREASI